MGSPDRNMLDFWTVFGGPFLALLKHEKTRFLTFFGYCWKISKKYEFSRFCEFLKTRKITLFCILNRIMPSILIAFRTPIAFAMFFAFHYRDLTSMSYLITWKHVYWSNVERVLDNRCVDSLHDKWVVSALGKSEFSTFRRRGDDFCPFVAISRECWDVLGGGQFWGGVAFALLTVVRIPPNHQHTQ